GLLVLREDGTGFFLERRRAVLRVGRHRAELHGHLLCHCAGFCDLGGDAGDPLDFGLADNRAAGEAPDAAVYDADAEAGRTAGATPAATSAAAPAKAAAAAAAETARGVAIGSAVRVHPAADAAREADVRVAAADALRFREG